MIKVGVVDKLQIVSGKIEGDLTLELAKAYFEEVGMVANQHGLKKVLTDLRSACLKADEQDMSLLARELTQLGVASSYRGAVVMKEDVRGYKQWENHCLSAGYREMRLFVDDETAMKWLSE